MEDLFTYYLEHIDDCIKRFDICIENYERTHSDVWHDLAISWAISYNEWEAAAREEGVYIV